jgi:hypothetical protein
MTQKFVVRTLKSILRVISGAGRPCHFQNCISTGWARKLDT